MRNIMADLIVSKFGGTSVADYDAMHCSANVILSNPDIGLVVLSASAGVTNLLISLSEGLQAIDNSINLSKLRKIHFNILKRMRNPKFIYRKIETIFNNIDFLVKKVSLNKSAALKDELISYGEFISTLLFVEILRERNINAQWFDIRKIMRTSDDFGHAKPNISIIAKLTTHHLVPLLHKGLVITQGFIGSEANGRTTTLGRGGSDYTATLLGEALHAQRVDIWTDVPGIYTTDPHLVPDAKRIDIITFKEAAEMITYGVKVLHPATLLPVTRSDIPMFIGSSKDPKAGGTIICKNKKNPPFCTLNYIINN